MNDKIQASQNNIDTTDIENELVSAPILKAILDAAPFALNLWDKNMNNIMCNKYILNIFDIANENEFLQKFETFSPEYQPNGTSSSEMSKRNYKKVNDEGTHTFHWLHKTVADELIPSEITLVRLDVNGKQDYIIGFIRDLRPAFSHQNTDDYDYYFTDSVPANILLHEISELSEEWFFSIDLRTGNMQQYMRSAPIETNGQSVSFISQEIPRKGLVHEDDIVLFQNTVENLKKGILEPCDVRFLNDKGEYRYNRPVYKMVQDKSGTPIFVIGKVIDVHENKILEERSKKDLLTHCYNKISAELIIAEKLKSSDGENHALFMIDIDNFKGINDNLGHYFGDEVLKEIATGLHSVFRESDLIARIGGDEFIVFLEDVLDFKLLSEKAAKILEVYQKTYSGEYKDYSISGSVGISIFPQNGTTYEELYKNADKALYQAKLSGKNRYVHYSDDLRIGTMRNITKIENADKIASAFFDYDLISAIFNILYERNGDEVAINSALKYICQTYDADRSYIFESLDKGATYDNTFEYCKKGISSESDNLQGLPGDIFADFIENAHNGIIYSNNLRETLQTDSTFEVMDNQGILSFVHAQIKKDGIMDFFIGLDDCTKTRVWKEREINSLQYIGKMISIILQGTHLREKVDLLNENNKNSAHILDSTDEIVYISDTETYDLLYLNQTAITAVGNPSKEVWRSKKCYEILQSLTAPCSFCTNHLLTQDKFYEWSYYNPSLDRNFLLKDKLIPFNGTLARLEIATDISQLTALETELQQKLDDERFLANCVEMLHSGSEPEVAIYELLERLSAYYQAERSYIFEVCEDDNFLSNTYEWCSTGVQSYKENLQNILVTELGFLFDCCKEHQSFSLNIDDAAITEDTLEYKFMKMQNLSYLIISPIVSEDNKVTGFVGVDNPKVHTSKMPIIQSVAKFIASFLDETELIARLNRLSYYDTLTDLRNRQSYNDTIMGLDKKYVESLGVIYVDINGLRAINDSKGNLFGDSILKRLSEILSDIFKDDVYRVGGDEFIIFKINTKEDTFEESVTSLKQQLANEKEFKTTIGYTWNKNFSDISDNLTYQNGNDKYTHILSENLDMEIASDKFVVFLQPQIDFATDEVRSAEALVRRIGAGNVFQPPIAFIPFYEKEGIISKIDTFVLKTVCKSLQSWRNSGSTQIESVAVNCSRMTIAKPGIVEQFSKICDNYGIDHSQIVIEITETTNEISEKVLKTIIQNFSDAGFSVSLDDFGSGYSNLTSLVISDFDEVKIDMRLINDIHQNEKSKALTEVVLILCEKLNGLISVAEGVEIFEQYDMLKEMGCTKGQGYYFDKPMPIEDFKEKYISTL